MSEEGRHILQMLQDGTISTEQAMELLEALDSDDGEADYPAMMISEPVTPSDPPPDLDKYRRWWKIPFFISLAVLLLFGFWLRAVYQSAEGAITFGFICVWTLFMFAGFVTLLAFLTRRATWLHVRIKEREGRRIAISLPLPLRLANWGIGIARGFVDDDTRLRLTMASEFIKAAQDTMREPGAEPLFINVNDDDGDHVQVYIG